MNERKSKRLFWWGLFVAWLVLTVYLSNQNGTGSASLSQNVALKFWRIMHLLFGSSASHISFFTFHTVFRKVTHFGVHLVLAFLLVRASCWTFFSRKTALWFAWLLAIMVATMDEVVQIAAPGRVSAVLDAGLNLSGTVVGAFISSLFGPKNLKS